MPKRLLERAVDQGEFGRDAGDVIRARFEIRSTGKVPADATKCRVPARCGVDGRN